MKVIPKIIHPLKLPMSMPYVSEDRPATISVILEELYKDKVDWWFPLKK